jgi:diguanylate cyclase (GGDEF)-like protein/PAS domain S-box-containing protein
MVSEVRYSNLIDSVNAAFCVVEMLFDSEQRAVDYRFVEINAAFSEQTGLGNALGKTIRELVPSIETIWIATFAKVDRTHQSVRFDSEVAALGSRWFEGSAFPTGDAGLHRVAGDAVICTDVEGQVSYLNGVAERLTGWSGADAIGRRLEDVFHLIEAESRAVIPNPMAAATIQNKVVGLPPLCILVRRDGTELSIEDSAAPIHDRHGRVTGAVMVFHDVSAARRLTRQLSHQAAHDGLTDLPNRSLLNDRLRQAIAAVHRHHTSLALLYLDLDRFKHINDSLGHAIGDQLLEAVAHRLTRCVRASDTVSRQGGDEFVILLIDIDGDKYAAACADKVLRALRAPYLLGDHEVHGSASIGIALCPQDGTESELLLRNADSAMYEAKARGRDTFQFYRKDLNASATARQALESGLRHAVDRDELELLYQPVMDIQSGAIASAEALIRWRHGDEGVLMPAHFMSIAEEAGLIVPIGRWVLRNACGRARADRDLPDARLEVDRHRAPKPEGPWRSHCVG